MGNGSIMESGEEPDNIENINSSKKMKSCGEK
ncbi:hypothetical protein TFUB4_00530 [Tannerella forsythia]|jgi:hypothetical protein|uniref:Uncharacterized protein n=1 Tax=Tannerella forsythia TaxID=28112 RepID=A0A1D3UG51_TANFO|nr:hypothetical protein TFUB4_00530 [Tannerella forsythia]SCQ18988.1 hypothetical protein TFUB20_00546 [Tannerella forsythia]SCQ19083.1 hypothetical protein TFUB22_00507 [Tannerella forsythia]